MKIQIDENNYIIGYTTVGEITEGIDVEYDEAVFEYGFAFYKYENGKIIFDEGKYNTFTENKNKEKQLKLLVNQADELNDFLNDFDKKSATYERCQKLNIPCDIDIENLTAEAVEKQKLFMEIQEQIDSLKAEII